MSDVWTHPGPWRVIVVGGGHAGCEAALAVARTGVATLLITQSVDRIGWMSCNPAIGGIGKTHLVAEIDALGGEMARNADRAGVHYKLLNQSRGPAVRALRAQCDKLEYATALRGVLEAQPLLALKQDTVASLWIEADQLRGVITKMGARFAADAVVLTAGTFLAGVLHTGQAQQAGGRAGEGAATGLGEQLRSLGVRTLRHKTGTCPRLDQRSIAWATLSVDPGLTPPPTMSRYSPAVALPQLPCHATETNANTHDIIRGSLSRSPMFSGAIEGAGPRYCPSIEDKVVRFSQRDSHLLYLEREGWRTQEVYLSGLSTSLPADVQLRVVRSIRGLEQAEIVRFGYAVEYDTIDPRQLGTDLQLPALPGLYFAGQVNGTSGYEEAAAQGLVAGLQASARCRGASGPELGRHESYIGVMIDDLVTRGGNEPYRMFTSRAEHRLSLRTGNADLRLCPKGRDLGLVSDEQWRSFQAREGRLEQARALLGSTRVRPDTRTNEALEAMGTSALKTVATAAELLRRPELSWEQATALLPDELDALGLTDDDRDELLTETRYAGYIEREKIRIERNRKAERTPIADDFDYAAVGALSSETIEALQTARPRTLGQAARLPGVPPAAVSALAIALEAARRAATRRQRGASRSR